MYPHLTYCTATKSDFYLYNFDAVYVSPPGFLKLLTFQVSSLVCRPFQRICRSPSPYVMFLYMLKFWDEELLVLFSTHKFDYHSLLAVDCM